MAEPTPAKLDEMRQAIAAAERKTAALIHNATIEYQAQLDEFAKSLGNIDKAPVTGLINTFRNARAQTVHTLNETRYAVN